MSYYSNLYTMFTGEIIIEFITNTCNVNYFELNHNLCQKKHISKLVTRTFTSFLTS